MKTARKGRPSWAVFAFGGGPVSCALGLCWVSGAGGDIHHHWRSPFRKAEEPETEPDNEYYDNERKRGLLEAGLCLA